MKDILYLFCLILVPFPTLLSPPISFHKAEGNDDMENERKKERERVERERESNQEQSAFLSWTALMFQVTGTENIGVEAG